MPGANVPFPPMEAQLVRTLPEGDGWQYEPKWDGFRGVLENDGGELAAARGWLDRFESMGLDGVVAKKLGVPYLPGSRDGVVKIKEEKTADCVVVGLRWKRDEERKIATLLLGLYRDDGGVDYVGSCAVAARARDDIA